MWQRIRFLFTGHLSPKGETCISESLRDFRSVLLSMKGQYVTHASYEVKKEALSKDYARIRSIWIPKRHALYNDVRKFIDNYSEFEEIVRKSNQLFLASEEEKYDYLFSDINGKCLDQQQRVAVITDEDANLVVAGAGSGKTLTIAGKVRYLCDAKGISPNDILLLSFTKKAAAEMQERIQNGMGISVDCQTFHSLGLGIIAASCKLKPEVEESQESFVYKYLENTMAKNSKELKALIQFFAYYLRIPSNLDDFESLGELYEHEREIDFETIQGRFSQAQYVLHAKNEGNALKKTLRHEQVRSLDEVEIANFLFLNGVRYEYEPLYPYFSGDELHRAYHPDFFLPDYGLYIEHFGVDRDGNLPWLSQIEAEKYKESMEWKRRIHKENGTCLLETYSFYSSEGRLLQELEKMLVEHDVHFVEPDFEEIFNAIYKGIGEKYFSEFNELCTTFISLFKSRQMSIEGLKSVQIPPKSEENRFMKQRTETFMKIVIPIINAYNERLEETNKVDFSDMINAATSIVKSGFPIHKYRWIIVDEYQDISMARFNLVHAMIERTGAKLLCVGDDWQSIYRFAGSDISLFTRFGNYFRNHEIMMIEKTYRNSQQLIDISGNFVMKNNQQIKKVLKSDIFVDFPVSLIRYSEFTGETVSSALTRIINENGIDSSVLVLGRTRLDFDVLRESHLFKRVDRNYLTYMPFPEVKIRNMTIHGAKGLEADCVLLLNFKNDTMGFPNKIVDDPLLGLVLSEPESFPYAEERRLLYVALTRARKRVYILVDESKPSEFMKEFDKVHGVRVLDLKGDKSEEVKISCPRCRTGHLVLRRNKSNTSAFLGCTNYPRCDYSLDDVSVLANPKTCPACGGFLVKRKSSEGFFYGCSNYPNCKYTSKW